MRTIINEVQFINPIWCLDAKSCKWKFGGIKAEIISTTQGYANCLWFVPNSVTLSIGIDQRGGDDTVRDEGGCGQIRDGRDWSAEGADRSAPPVRKVRDVGQRKHHQDQALEERGVSGFNFKHSPFIFIYLCTNEELTGHS